MQKLLIAGVFLVLLAAGYGLYIFTSEGDSGLTSGTKDVARTSVAEDESFRARRTSSEQPEVDTGRPPVENGAETANDSNESMTSGLTGNFVHATTKEPVAEVEVRYVDLAGQVIGRCRSAEGGSFRLPLPSPRPEGRLHAATAALIMSPLSLNSLTTAQVEDLGTIALLPAVNVVGIVQDKDGKAVPGALVELYPHTKFDFRNFDLVSLLKSITSEEPPVLFTSTDDAGAFRFDEVAARDWVICASKKGHGSNFSTPFQAGTPAAEDLRVSLLEGAQMKGVVQDEQNQPIANVRVLVFPENSSPGSAMRTFKTTSGVDGKFEMNDMPVGEMQVIARGRGWVSASQVRAKVPTEDDCIVLMRKSGKISGKITNLIDDSPIAGVEVLGMQMQSGSFQITYSDAEGLYVLEDMPRDGEVMVLARKEGYAMQQKDAPSARGFRMPGIEVPPTELASGDAHCDIVMTAGTKVSGRVTDPTTGLGVEGAKVSFTGAGGGFGNMALGKVEAITDKQGEFSLSGIPAGRFALIPTKAGYFQPNNESMLAIRSIYDEDVTAVLEVAEGQTLGGIELKLQRGLVCQGKVVDGKGKPVKGARVQAVKLNPDDEENNDFVFFMGGGMESLRTSSDASGSFEMEGLEPNSSYEFHAYHKAFPSSEKVEVVLGVAAIEPITLKILPAGKVHGRVLRTDGSPAVGLELTCYIDMPMAAQSFDEMNVIESNRSSTTDENGRYEFADLPAGSHNIWLAGNSEYVLEQEVHLEVASGETRQQDIRVRETVYVEGRVVDEKGRGISDVWIYAEEIVSPDADGNTYHAQNNSGYSTDDGVFRISSLKAEARYKLSIRTWRAVAAVDASGVDEVVREIEESSMVTVAELNDVEAGSTGLIFRVKRADVEHDDF